MRDPEEEGDRARGLSDDLRGLGRAATDASRDARGATAEVKRLTDALSRGLSRSVSRLIVDGGRASDALRGVGLSLARTALSAALRPVRAGLSAAVSTGASRLVSGLAGAVGFARGGAFVQGRALASPPAQIVAGAKAFARGGVVDGPTFFGMRSGLGLMGEAGPEAVMPLARGPDGRLGVRAQGGAGSVNVTIQTRDAASFRRSRTQIAAQVARAVDRGRRGL